MGKAAAMLFAKAKIKEVYAKTLSVAARKVLEKFGLGYQYDVLTETIINRDGTDTCPMEKAVAQAETPDEAYSCIKKQLQLLNSKNI